MSPALETAIHVYEAFILSYFVVINGTYLTLCVLAFFAIRDYLRRSEFIHLTHLFRSGLAPGVSIVSPAYNEETTVLDNVKSLLSIEYPNVELVVVNDGSKDATLDILRRTLDLQLFPRAPSGQIPTAPVRAVYRSAHDPRVVVVDKENGGSKADATNAGINYTRNPLVCVIDADSLLDPDVLLKLVRPFLEDSRTIAAGGVVRIANECRVEHGRVTEMRLPKSSLARFQVVEYLRSFLFGRTGWAQMNALLIVSGAFGLFSRQAVLAVGGYRADAIGEDIDLVLRLHRHYGRLRKPYRIAYVPSPICWTEAPEHIRDLASQRNRWQRGLLECLWRYRELMFRPQFGAAGMLAFPFFVFFELLGPIVEFSGFLFMLVAWPLGIMNWSFAIAFFAASVLLGVILSLSSLIFEGLTFRRYPATSTAAVLALYAVLENFGYRQIHTWWRLCGIWDRLRGKKSWGQMRRRGFRQDPPAPSSTEESDTLAA
ncbi:MAG TPA: glycosyltransferase family 2 protein [Candidatus Limnocylindria bacterium]|nr:glycosyltransferase family 2 protein [Candidatus Limnocylindria bacterium]